jgi:hypothetical protein
MVTIAVGGNGDTGPESVPLLLIVVKWCGPEGTGERRFCGEQGRELGGVCGAVLRANEKS